MYSSLGDLDATDYYSGYTSSSDSYENVDESTPFDLEWTRWVVITLIICCFGFGGNGCIIWLLGFQIKRNSFTTFILNLAVADSGYLMSIVIFFIDELTDFQGSEIYHDLCISFIHVTYINANFLMTAISIDRCVSVLFPIWHRSSRPKHLSPAVCASLWICSVLLVGITFIKDLTEVTEHYNLSDLPFLVSAVICLPLITLCTGVLLVKVRFKLKQRNQGRVLLTILITFLCFLILAFPLSICAVINIFHNTDEYDDELYWFISSILLPCLNSSINPVIYFLAGMKKGAQSEKSMKVILQNAFNESETTSGR